MSMKTFRALALAAALCAWGGAAAAQQTTGTRDRDRLSGDEIRATNKDNLFDAIRALRPQWMNRRGRGTILGQEFVVVYRDGFAEGPPAVMREMNLQEVTEVVYLNAADATTRYGTGHQNGAILISTRSVTPAPNRTGGTGP